ncbi:MAG: class I SAM-dependent methyltransferase [Terriglobales bacterium]
MVDDPTLRFSNRVEDYARYRPGYPAELLELLRRECGWTPEGAIADIGCGTGILSRIFCEQGNRVYGVEPNESMLQSARESLKGCVNFTAIQAPAEATTLADRSVDLITAAQSFHWFEPRQAKREFVRILKRGGWVVLLWNERLEDATPFMVGYEQLLVKFGVDYHKVKPLWQKNSLPEFFAPLGFRTAVFKNPQTLDRAGLAGRILSASYMPHREHASYATMVTAMDELFHQYEQGGKVRLEQETRVFYGQLG